MSCYIEQLGNVMYKVSLEAKADVVWRRHANQRIVSINVALTIVMKVLVNTPCPLCRDLQNLRTYKSMGSSSLRLGQEM